MKRQTVSIFTFLLATSSFFFACGNSSQTKTGGLEFDSITVNERQHLFGDTAKPSCHITINVQYASKAIRPQLQDSLNAYLLAFAYGEKYTGQTPQNATAAYVQKYVSDYRKDLEPVYEKDIETDGEDSWLSFYRKVTGKVELYKKDLLVYNVYFDEYTGGAHGIYASNFMNIDLRSFQKLSLDDLFVVDYKDYLTDLLWNQLMADNHVTTRAELEDMGYTSTGELEPTENFALSKEGITFFYNVYEIGPYAMGPVVITLPFDAIRHLLRDENNILDSLN